MNQGRNKFSFSLHKSVKRKVETRFIVQTYKRRRCTL